MKTSSIKTLTRHLRPATTLLALAALFGIAPLTNGCDSDDRTIPEAWSSLSLEQAPTLFEQRDGHPAPADLPGELHLGQAHDAAMEILKSTCPNTVRRDSNSLSAEAFFVGCRLAESEAGPLHSLRIGFWPRIDKKSATLEAKRDHVDPGIVWRRFRQVVDEDQIRRKRWTGNILMVWTPRYRLFADWDEGDDGPHHRRLRTRGGSFSS